MSNMIDGYRRQHIPVLISSPEYFEEEKKLAYVLRAQLTNMDIERTILLLDDAKYVKKGEPVKAEVISPRLHAVYELYHSQKAVLKVFPRDSRGYKIEREIMLSPERIKGFSTTILQLYSIPAGN
jgi:sulfur relay (sulfurtransferase) complex TusBCD TusD component (DsrE family)